MLLAELEVWHTKPSAPTRRVAVGDHLLPVDPPPGFGGILLGGVVAAHVGFLDEDELVELRMLVDDLAADRRVPQPRLRHRFQTDRIGLAKSRHALVGDGEDVHFLLAEPVRPAAQVLGAVYAVREALDPAAWGPVFAVLRRALTWRGGLDPQLAAHLTGGRAPRIPAAALADPAAWASSLLGLRVDASRDEVMRRFRTLVRDAHPDHGGSAADASQRIVDLTEARRILLS